MGAKDILISLYSVASWRGRATFLFHFFSLSFFFFFPSLNSAAGWTAAIKNTFHFAGQRPEARSRKSGIKCFLYLERGMTKVKLNPNTNAACSRLPEGVCVCVCVCVYKGQLSDFFFLSKSLKDNYSGSGNKSSQNKTRKAAAKRKQVEIWPAKPWRTAHGLSPST